MIEGKITGFCFVNLFLCFLVVFSHARSKKEKETEIETEEITIVGDQMELLQKENVVSFIGNVKLVRGNNVITADKMKSFEKKGIVEGEGNVHFIGSTEKNEQIEIFGGKVLYYKKKNYGEISKNPRLIRKLANRPDDKPLEIICNLIRVNITEEEVTAHGAVEISKEGLKGRAEKGIFFNKSKKIILTDNPQIFRKDGKNTSFYKADEITVVMNEKKILLEGNVTGTIIFEDKK